MKRKIVLFTFVSLLSLSTVFGTIWSTILMTSASPRTWTADDDGPADFHTIQGAIDDYRVENGDIIEVLPGEYYENIIIDKSLNLIGVNGKDTTIIDAGDIATDTVVTIKSSNVRMENFTIKDAPELLSAGIRIRTDLESSSGIVIHKNKISNVHLGISAGFPTGSEYWPKYPLNDVEITENTISMTSVIGVYLQNGTSILISSNTFPPGIGLNAIGLVDLNETEIYGNNMSRYDSGVELHNGYFNNITENTITDIENSIDVAGGSFNTIAYNTIIDAGRGVSLNGSSSTITKNTIKNFAWSGIRVYGDLNNVTTNTIQSGQTAISGGEYISSNEIQDCTTGIHDGNYASDNEIQDCTFGLRTSGNASIINNFFRNCDDGVVIDGNFSTVSSNTFYKCLYGVITLNGTNGNVIYHNMFLNSTAADNSEEFVNSWDAGILEGGNYWSDYKCEDGDDDNVFGDTPCLIYNEYGNVTINRDNYPLVIPPCPIPVFWRETKYECNIVGNMTVSGFCLNENKTIVFNIIGHGYANLSIPRTMLDGSFQVFVDNTPIPCLLSWNKDEPTHVFIYFEHATSIPLNVRIEALFKIQGDLNGDGQVNILDIATIAINFGETL